MTFIKIQRKQHKKAFTLVELIAVIAILGILVMLATPNFIDTKRTVSGKEILNNIRMVEYHVSMKETMTEENVVDYFNLSEIDTNAIQEAHSDKRLFNKNGYAQINYLEGFYDLSNTEVTENISGSTDGTFAINGEDIFFIANSNVNVGMEYVEDTTPPVITISHYSTDPTNQDAVVCATANEGYLNENCHTFTENGEYTFIATDLSGNRTEETVIIDFIDKEAPEVVFVPNGDNDPKKSQNANTTVTDAANSVDDSSLEYAWSTSATAPGTGWAGFSSGDVLTKNTGTGNYHLFIRAADNLGNSHMARSETFNIDNTPPAKPTITADTSTGFGHISINYSADSVQEEYKINTGAWTTYTGEITISYNATIYARGVDIAGNESDIADANITVDTLPPTIAFTTNGSAHYNKSQGTIVNISDDKSGVDASSLQYAWSTSTTTPSTGWASFANGETLVKSGVTGTYYLHIKAADTIGNATTTRSNAFNIDNTIPTITIGINGNATYKKSQSTTVSASDVGGGVATLQYAWSTSTATPSSGWTSFSSGSTITKNSVTGGYYLHIKAVDEAGNIKNVRSNVFNLDNTIPTVSFGTNGSTTPKKSHSTTVSVSDNVSVSTRQYAWSTSTATPSSGWVNFANGATITRSTGTGNHYLHTKATDSAGNVRNSRSNAFSLDNTAPTITIHAYTQTPTYESVTVTASASGGTLDTSSHTFTSNGSFMFTARDSAGNIANRSVTVSNIVKLNSFVRVLTRYRYVPYQSMDIIFTKDNHYITVGNSQYAAYGHSNNGGYDGIVRKYDTNGNLQYSKNYGSGRDDYLVSGIQAANGDLILVGEIRQSYSDDTAWIIRTDINGNLIKSAQLDGSDEEDFGDVAQLTDGNFVAIGETKSIDGDFSGINPDTYSRAIMIKYDYNLNVVWKKIIDDEDIDINSITADSDGGYLVTGHENGSFSRSRSYIAKFNKDGIEQWNYLQTEYDKNSFKEVVQSGNNYIAVGYNIHNDREDRERTRIATFDKSGNLINEKILSDRRIRLDKISLMPDGGFVSVGGYDGDGMIQKYSSNGTLLHQKIFDPYIHASVRDVVATPDGGYAIVGEISSDGLAIVDPEFVGNYLPDNQKGSFIIKYTKDGAFN